MELQFVGVFEGGGVYLLVPDWRVADTSDSRKFPRNFQKMVARTRVITSLENDIVITACSLCLAFANGLEFGTGRCNWSCQLCPQQKGYNGWL
jgi:hypothetical protein